jgi:protein TonB
MVHAISHATRPAVHAHMPRLDRNRIFAGAGAIALNAALLMLLLVPITAPQLLPESIRPDVVIIDRIEPKPVPPLPVEPERPEPEPVQRAQPVPEVPIAAPIIAPAVEPMPLDIAARPVTDPPPGNTRAEPSLSGPPARGTRLSYAHAPAPPYPREMLINGIEGTVVLEVLVDVDGRPLEVAIARSSGYRDLDRAAQRQVLRHWRFEPALRDGQPVQARGLVPIEFSLE